MKGFIKVHAIGTEETPSVDAVILALRCINACTPATNFVMIDLQGGGCLHVTESIDQLEELINNAKFIELSFMRNGKLVPFLVKVEAISCLIPVDPGDCDEEDSVAAKSAVGLIGEDGPFLVVQTVAEIKTMIDHE